MLRRDVDILNVFAQRQNEFTGFASRITLVDDVAGLVQLNVGLTNHVFVFFPCRQIKRPGLIVSLAAVSAGAFVSLLNFFQRQVLTMLELRVAAISYADVLNDLSVSHFPVWSFDETKLIDARKTRETGNQANVRTLRRLNRTNAAVVSRVNVAHLESGALARQSAGSQCRQAALVGDL